MTGNLDFRDVVIAAEDVVNAIFVDAFFQIVHIAAPFCIAVVWFGR